MCFAGWDFTEEDVQRPDFADTGYRNGVPMGGDLRKAPKSKSPTLMVRALRDPDGANLDRIQIIKGWADKKGRTYEEVYDVAWSDDRKLDSKGKLPPVGNTVDVEKAQLHQQHWRCAADGLLERSGLRSKTTGVLLRTCSGNSDASLDSIRREVAGRRDARGNPNAAAGTRLHEPDLVYAGELKPRFSILV